MAYCHLIIGRKGSRQIELPAQSRLEKANDTKTAARSSTGWKDNWPNSL